MPRFFRFLPSLVLISSPCVLFADATLHVRIFDKATGLPLPSKVFVELQSGGGVPPVSNPYMLDHGPAVHYKYNRSYVSKRPYFFYSDDFTIRVPPGIVYIRCRHGFEYENKLTTVTVVDGVDQSIAISLERKIDLPSLGWYNWDPHNHVRHDPVTTAGAVLLSAREAARTAKANGMNFAFLTEKFNEYSSIESPQARDMNLVNFLVAPETSRDFKGLYNHEQRNRIGAHLSVFFDEDITTSTFQPWVTRQGGYSPSPNPNPLLIVPDGSLTGAADANHARGYLIFPEHSVFPAWRRDVIPGISADVYGGMPGIIDYLFGGLNAPRKDGSWYSGFSGEGQARELPVAAALGKWDSIGLLPYSAYAQATIETWYHLLNTGLKIPPHAGVDNCMDRSGWGDPGARRAYTYIQPNLDLTNGAIKPFSLLKQAIKTGRTFVTNGPLVFFTVNGALPGDEVNLPGEGAQAVSIDVTVQSFGDTFSRVELVRNGQVIRSLYNNDSTPIDSFKTTVTLDNITDSCWLALRVRGNQYNYWNSSVGRPFNASYPDPVGTTYWGSVFAHTNAVFVRYGGKKIWDQNSANYFIDWLTRLRDYQAWIKADAPTHGLIYEDSAYNEYVSTIDLALDYFRASVPGKLQFSVASYEVSERGATAQIVVRRVGVNTGPASVQYATSDGTAIAGQDYTALTGTLYWANGESAEKTITVPILADGTVEAKETFSVALTDATGSTLGFPVGAVVTIADWSPGSLSAVTLSPTSVTGGKSTTGNRVTLTTAAPPGGAVVTLSASDPSGTVPSSVTIPEGALVSPAFTIGTKAVHTARTVTITATRMNQSRTADLTVQAPALLSLTVSATSAVGGKPVASNQVTLDGSAAATITVALSSGNPAVAEVPSSVTVPIGSTASPVFAITTFAVLASTTVPITATYNGVSKTVNLTVNPVSLQSVTLSPTSVAGGKTTTANKVNLDGPAPSGGIVVTLASSDPSVAVVPASVAIAAGAASSPAFSITTNTVRSTRPVTITVTYNGVSRSTNLTVKTAGLYSLTLSPATTIGGATTTSNKVTLDGAAAEAVTVSLTSTNPAASVPPTVVIPAGATYATFAVTTTPVSALSPATITATFNGITKSRVVTVAPAALASFTLSPASTRGTTTTTLNKISLSGAAPVGGYVVSLSSSNPAVASVPASVTVQAGSTSTAVSIRVVPGTAPQVVTLTATAGSVSKSASLATAP